MSSHRFRPRRRTTPELNVTSLIDVVLLLLLFFMLSTTFNHYGEIRIELPDANAPATVDPSDAIEVDIDQAGQFFVGQRQVVNTRVDTLRTALRQALGARTAAPVIIAADARTPHQAVITAMDAASQLGLSRITFATVREAAGD